MTRFWLPASSRLGGGVFRLTGGPLFFVSARVSGSSFCFLGACSGLWGFWVRGFWVRGFGSGFFGAWVRGGLSSEHLQHPVGDHEPSDHVGGREDHRHQPDGDGDRGVRAGGDHDRAHQDDAVDRVGPRHQGRVQDRRHLGDDLDADEDRQHEEGHLVEELVAHWVAPASCLALSLTISPPCVMQQPLVISSSKSRLMAPSLTRCRSRLATLRA